MKQKNIYLVAQYYMKPKDHVNTSIAGWKDNPDNIRYDEQINIVRGLKSKDLNSQVVLDLTNMKIEKNSFNSGKDFDEIFRYFFENYDKYITTVMSQLNPGYLVKLIETMQAELDAAQPDVVDVAAEVINEETQAQ